MLDPNKDYYRITELNPNEVRVLKSMGYQEVSFEPFGQGVGQKWLVLPHGMEGAVHALMTRVLRDEVKKYSNNVFMNYSVEPDVVAICNCRKIAFEVETGSWVKGKHRLLEQRFNQLKAKYGENYYIVVTKAALSSHYKRFGVVITKTRLQSAIQQIFNHQ